MGYMQVKLAKMNLMRDAESKIVHTFCSPDTTPVFFPPYNPEAEPVIETQMAEGVETDIAEVAMWLL